ncbi:MAG: hypothetical protein RSC76_09775, partial [Oscillospiraceae bacterium]
SLISGRMRKKKSWLKSCLSMVSSGRKKAATRSICRAGQKILAEQDNQIKLGEEEKTSLDIGFKVFKLDTSNLKLWDGTPVTEEQIDLLFERMNHMIDSVKHDRSDLDVIYEIMLKMGVPLTYPVLPIDITGVKAYSIGEDCLLLVCLAEGITSEIIAQMTDYAPAKLILAESCLADDTAMRNAHYILRNKKIELKLV